MALSKLKKKAPKSEAEDALHDICIVNWDTEYRILFHSDDMGEHIVVAFEGEVPPDSKDILRTPFMGWRLVRLEVPEDYLGTFYPLGDK